MGRVTCRIAAVLAGLAVFFCFCSGDATADGLVLKTHARKVLEYSVVRRAPCPDRYSCYSLYGAYGPYGGRAYWTRYTAAGWYR